MRRTALVVALGVFVSSCSAGGRATVSSSAPAFTGTTGTTATTGTTSSAISDDPITACLVPPQPQPRPATGWLSGLQSEWMRRTDQELPVSATTKLIAVSFARAAAQGYGVAATTDLGLPACLLERYVGISRSDGATGYLVVLQLGEAIDGSSFPINVNVHRDLAGGAQLLAGDFEGDSSLLSAVEARRDGLLVFVLIASAHSANTSGWPTTIALPSTQPHTRAPLTLDDTIALTEHTMAIVSSQGQ